MPGRKTYVGTATETELAAGINSTDTTVTLVDGSTYGSPTPAAPMVIVIGADTPAEEQVLISGRSGNILTVAANGRNYQAGGGTTGVLHGMGEVIRHVLDADSINDANRHVNTDADDDHSQYHTAARFVTAHDVEARHAFGAALGAPGTPAAIGTGAASAGTGDDAAREDHVHNHNPPACRVTHSVNQSVADLSAAQLAFDTELYDTDSMHSSGANTRITFNTAGLYVVGGAVEFAAGADYLSAYVGIFKNGNTLLQYHGAGTMADANIGIALTTCLTAKFAVADYIELRVFQNNTANAARNALTGAHAPSLFATWVGTG